MVEPRLARDLGLGTSNSARGGKGFFQCRVEELS